MRAPATRDPLRPMPTSPAEAIRDIEWVFDNQPSGGWDERDRRVFVEGIGLEYKPLARYSRDELKAILGEMRRLKMVLYRKR